MTIGQPVLKAVSLVTAFVIAAVIVYFVSKAPPAETGSGFQPQDLQATEPDMPGSVGDPASSEIAPLMSTPAPPPPQPEALVSPATAAPKPSSGEQSGTGSLIPVTAMPEADVYDALMIALARGDEEIGQVALRTGNSFEARACRAYAFATTGKRAEAESLISGMGDVADDLRQESFLLVVQAELAFRGRDTAAASKLFDEAVRRTTNIPDGTEGVTLAYLASARFYLATGDKQKAKQLSQDGLRLATLASERNLASKIQ